MDGLPPLVKWVWGRHCVLVVASGVGCLLTDGFSDGAGYTGCIGVG
jgi:hypothetical protein